MSPSIAIVPEVRALVGRGWDSIWKKCKMGVRDVLNGQRFLLTYLACLSTIQ